MERRIYTKNEDGTTTITTVPYTTQDIIAEKEAKLLEMYDEIKKLKEE